MSNQLDNSSQNFTDKQLMNMPLDKIKQIVAKKKKVLGKILRNIKKRKN